MRDGGTHARLPDRRVALTRAGTLATLQHAGACPGSRRLQYPAGGTPAPALPELSYPRRCATAVRRRPPAYDGGRARSRGPRGSGPALCDLSRRIQSARELWSARAARGAALGAAVAGPQDGVDRSLAGRAV